jgi:outer membrane lipoprotein SlyB
MFRRLTLILALLLAGCAGGQHGIGARDSDKEVVQHGVIESVKAIEMDASSNAGAMAGGIFGQVGGATAGDGRGAVVGSVFGSVLGGTLGQQAGVSVRPGMELWVRQDGAEQSTYVMQPGNSDAFRVGDRVRLVTKQGNTRVEPDTPPVKKP